MCGAVKAAQQKQGTTEPDTKLGLCQAHFPAYLLRVLYGQRCFASLKHFVKIFPDLQALGCEAPGPSWGGCVWSM